MATTPEQPFLIPDVAGIIEGWRAWGVPRKTYFGVPPKLYSVTHRTYFWKPREINQADCKNCCGDQCPGQKCTCGFYSANSFARLQSLGYHRYDAERRGMFHVVGRVANWGGIVPADFGCRAEKSYPIELFVPYEAWRLAEPLSDLYGVPVQLKNILEPVH